MTHFAALVVLLAAAAAAPARAETCALAVALEGEAALVVKLGAELEGRGIEIRPACTNRTARVERRGDALVISIVEATHAPIEREVRGMKTAAAVIESFVRDDLGTPLLEVRALVSRSPVVPPPREAPKRSAALSGVHVFGALESSVASDGTAWDGMHVGACVMVGRLCAGGRLRGSKVTSEDELWPQTRRESGELMFGLDVPFRLRRFLVTPGVAAGFGAIATEPESEMPSISANFRAETHVAFSVPLSRSFAVDLSVVGTLAQQVKREPGYMEDVPAEPYGFLRFGVGLRWGRR